ncbi:hypothetical protein [Sphingomonas sp.]|uniref:hypothetical protein n=1 Tax=Sphingomonas sp. TaxID=28214 RepID=UPI003CC504EE
MYKPMFSGARQVRAGWIDDRHWVELLADIEAIGLVAYKYLLALHRTGVEDPVLWVSAEESADMFGSLFASEDSETTVVPRAKSFTLGAFVNDAHENYGRSPDWGDESAFEARAFEIVRSKLASGAI